MARRQRSTARPDSTARSRRAAAPGVRHAPTHTGPVERHAGILQLQRTIGNRQVARLMGGAIQRDPAPKAPAKAKEEAAEAADSGWKPIEELITKELGPEKIKEHAKTLAGKSVDLLMAQVKDATSEQDFVAKSQVQMIGAMLTKQAKEDAEALMKSDAGKALRDRLISITQDEPGAVVAVALTLAAVAYLANPDLPEIKKKVQLAKGLTAEGNLDIGKVQSLAVQKAGLALKFSRKQFAVGVAGSYAGEGDKEGLSGAADLSVKPAEDVEFKGSVKINPDGSATVNVAQAIDLKKFRAESGIEVDKGEMAAIVAVKVGDKDTYVSGKTKVNQQGEVTVDLNLKAAGVEFGGKAKGLGGDKPSGEASVKGTNIFGVRGLDAKGQVTFGAGGVSGGGGSVSYSADTRRGTAFITFDAQAVPGADKSPPIGVQATVGVGFRFGSSGSKRR